MVGSIERPVLCRDWAAASPSRRNRGASEKPVRGINDWFAAFGSPIRFVPGVNVLASKDCTIVTGGSFAAGGSPSIPVCSASAEAMNEESRTDSLALR